MSEPQITTPISAANGAPPTQRAANRSAPWLPRHVRGLLGREWLAHHRLLCACWALWLAFGLALPLFHHPGWILALGIAYALGVAPAIGGLDAREGSEEFAFGLPATRSEIYRTRAALCIGTLITLLAAGLGSIALSLPGHLWSLVADSGFATPFPSTGLAWYVYAAMVPLALSACTFATAISSGSGSALGAVMVGLVLTAVVAAAGMIVEAHNWDHLDGAVSGPALATLAGAALLAGHHRYIAKEGVSRPVQPSGAGKWLLVAFGIVLLVLALLWTATAGRTVAPAPSRGEPIIPIPPREAPIIPPAAPVIPAPPAL